MDLSGLPWTGTVVSRRGLAWVREAVEVQRGRLLRRVADCQAGPAGRIRPGDAAGGDSGRHPTDLCPLLAAVCGSERFRGGRRRWIV